MNQKITIKTEAGEISYFILDPDQAIDQQLAILHGREIGHETTFVKGKVCIFTIS